MKFYDLTNFEDELIGEVVEFDDGACVLKFSIYKKMHCFDDYPKLANYLKSLRLQNVKLFENGVIDDN